jgi:hypothetical protein
MDVGYQSRNSTINNNYSWVVQLGDVGAILAVAGLFVSGLLSMVSVVKYKKGSV